MCPQRAPRTKRYRTIEPRWVAEYCTKFHANDIVGYRVPLGPVPKELVEEVGLERALRLYRPWRPEVDALVITPTAIILYEAKVHRYIDGLAKLPLYKALVPDTPELQKYLPRQIIMRLLVPVMPTWLIPAAKRLGVEMIAWAPDWVLEVWKERDRYWTPEAVAERERRKKILEALGFY